MLLLQCFHLCDFMKWHDSKSNLLIVYLVLVLYVKKQDLDIEYAGATKWVISQSCHSAKTLYTLSTVQKIFIELTNILSTCLL